MALVRLLLGPMVGKLGNYVYQGGSGGTIVRSLGIKKKQSTNAQSSMRALFSNIVNRWDTVLSEVQRVGWNELAATVTEVNPLGDDYSISGFNLFVRLNFNLAIAEVGDLSVAPADLSVASISSLVTAPLRVGDTEYQLEWSPVIPAGHALFVNLKTNVSAGRSTTNGKFLFSGVYGGAGDGDAMVALVPAGVTAVLGKKLFGEAAFINTVNGVVGPAIGFDVIVTVVP